MSTLLNNGWLVFVVPAVLAGVIGVAGRRESVVGPLLAAAGALVTVAVALAALVSSPASPEVHGGSAALAAGGFAWFSTSGSGLRLLWAVDGLAAWMLLVVGVVAACVVVFSAGYLHGDRGWGRYFAVVSLFVGSMNLLVIADSLTSLFVGWELVGACSFLLIGFWFDRPRASAAAMKAFLTTRVGDVGLLVGIAVLWSATGSDAYRDVFSALHGMPASALNLAAAGLAVGAMGKSAQFPFHGWLPDAMEGPTPVSALIHAATMVAAGVYLVARVWPIFEASASVRLVLLAAGSISALGAALVATVQRDIKKVLAYSTISQLGFMFAALGAGAPAAAFFHLVTHAAFKGLLFLTSGSVIHGAGTQDLHEMGGLRQTMPFTFVAWGVGVLALCGIAPLSGFFSKDGVLEAVWHSAPPAAVSLFAASALTAFYSARATRLAFFGARNGGARSHEGGLVMLLPLGVLMVPATAAGLLARPIASALGHDAEPLALGISVAALALAAVGAVAGWSLSATPEADDRVQGRLGAAGRWLRAAYGWDRFVDSAVVRPAVWLSRSVWAWGDRLMADGVVVGLGAAARAAGGAVRRAHNGDAQAYATTAAAAIALMLAVTIWLGR